MALLNKLKSLLGLGDGRSGSDRQGTDDVGVTVEREPGEPAEEEAPPATPAPGTEAAEPEPAAESEPEATDSEPEPAVEPEVESPPAEDTLDESPEDLDGRGSTPEPEPESTSGPEPVETAEDEDEGALVESESEPIERVEPEPAAEDEAAEGTEPEGGAEGEPASAESAGDDEPLREIKGIGPSYATKLSEAGVESAADLAAADAGELSEATGLSEKRIQGWIDRAQKR
ncbi:helix-hairpin-helix domain-containing protein [Halalkalicoccus sp. NIPERK01]|uniref:helix-hairpin-helix domain-containing protein n=1 Tax=Halalkalicoccus sp. NIPERK01 TaxID=3053469 RepID=UPI00256F46AD|nr:helix-hairpin-helix domain-containing protein [Halalkalicoccus sp. NIPERK01]MDL5361640.1 helix-hairpin-helix domain-containing protein [Halalkalicoccus sp. NIPERK01]